MRGTAISFFAMGVTWAIVILLLVLPYSRALDYTAVVIPLVISVFFWTVYSARKQGLSSHYLIGAVSMTGCLLAYPLVIGVSFRNEIVAPALDGRVCGVARSSNHHYPMVKIQNLDNSITSLEGVSEGFWASIRVGDRISKPPGSVDAVVGGRRVEIVEHSLLDAVRLRPVKR